MKSVQTCVNRRIIHRLTQINTNFKYAWFILFSLLSIGFLAKLSFASNLSDAEATIVIYNKNEPESKKVASYYAMKRGITDNSLCEIACSTKEEISRLEYNNHILRPIYEFVKQHHLIRYGIIPTPDGSKLTAATSNKLRYIVLCYGIPLKIAHEPSEPVNHSLLKGINPKLAINAASVDSELANLPILELPVTAYLPNPLFDRNFSQVMGWNLRMLCVARLDGPTAQTAKDLVDRALQAENSGLYGRVFFDLRGSSNISSSYKPGEETIQKTKVLFEEKWWETVTDETGSLFNEAIDASDCVVYSGWYEKDIGGPFRFLNYRFAPGAIVYHLHSLSAETLRSTTSGWTGPFILRGAAASLGTVYEPYLQLTPHSDIFFKRLLEGCSFGEASYSSQEFLSWMTTVVGDPLYRPFALSNDERIAILESHPTSLSEQDKENLAWAYRFKSRRMFLAGSCDEAIQLASQQANRLQQPTLWIGIANLYLLNNDLTKAAESIKEAVNLSRNKTNEPSILRFAALVYARAHNWKAALEIYHEFLTLFPHHIWLSTICKEAKEIAILLKNPAEKDFFEEAMKDALKKVK